MDSLFAALPVLGRGLVGLYFAFFGLWNIYHWRPTMEIMIQKNIPLPFLLLSFGIGWQIILGVMIMFGMLIKLAALLLIPFTIISLCIFHDFWNFKGEHRKHNLNKFISNVTVSLGSLLLLINNLSPITSWSDLLS